MKQSFYQIYYNSRYSKSRKALELLKLRIEGYKIIRYLEIGIDENVLSSILNSKNIPKDDLIRKNEITFKKLNLSKIELNKNEIKKLIIENPMLLQRPLITEYTDDLLAKSVLGRPPETLNTLLN